MKKYFPLTFLFLLITLLAMAGCSSIPQKTNTQIKQWSSPPKMSIDPNKTYLAHIDTNKGAFTIELLAKDAPTTVNNFVFLAKEHFYDNVIFHRIMKTFMIQTGDPQGNGTGGPGYNIKDELSKKYKYEKGIVAMANQGSPNTGGSQFFICSGPESAGLNDSPTYTVFGKVSSGMDIVDKIAATPVAQNPTGEYSSPVEKVFIKTVTIEEK